MGKFEGLRWWNEQCGTPPLFVSKSHTRHISEHFRFRGVDEAFYSFMKYKPILGKAAICIAMTFGAVDVAAAANVAQVVGGKSYSSILLAFNNCPNGGTVKLLADITKEMSKVTIAANTTKTLDLAGYSVAAKNTANSTKSFLIKGTFILKDSEGQNKGKIQSISETFTTYPIITVESSGNFIMESGSISTSYSGTDNNAIYLSKGGKVTINGGIINAGVYALFGYGNDISTTSSITINGGTITSATDYAIFNPQNGSVTVNGGSITGYAGGIAMRRGELTVNGGTIKSEGKASLPAGTDGTNGLGNAAINCSSAYSNVTATIDNGEIITEGNALAVDADDSQISSNTVSIAIKGGTFSGETASIEPYVDEGSLTKEEDGKVTVQAGYYAAKVGENKYESLSEAIEAAESGQTVKVLSDVSEADKVYTVTKDLTLDLNGKNVNVKSLIADNGAALTLEDNTATEAPAVSSDYNTVTYTAGELKVGGSIIAENGSSITVNSGRYANSNNTLFYSHGDKTGASEIKSTVTVNGGYLQSQEFTVSPRGKGAIANVNGGVLVAKDNAVVAGNGSKGLSGTTINIAGGTMIGHIESNGYVSCGVYHPQEGVLNISGGKIVAMGGCGILVRSGQLNLTGGEVIATGDASLLGKVGDSRVVVGTTGVIFDRDANYPSVENAEVEISGTAKVSGTKAAVEVINTSGVASAEDAVSVKGGTFSSDVSDYCEDGYAAAKNNDGTYGVVTGDVLLVTADGYQTFSAQDKALEFSTADLTKLYVNADIEDASVKMTKTFSTTNWSSFYVPFDINVTAELLEKFSFAEIWDTELVDGAATIEFRLLSEGDKIDANTPCLVKALTEGDNVLELTGTTVKKNTSVAAIDCSSIKQKFTFYGVNENTTLLDKCGYFINPNDQKFHPVTKATQYISPTAFYMTIQNKSDNSYDYPSASQSEAKTISFIVNGDETNGIKDVKGDAQTAAKRIYSIQGVYMGTDSSKLPAGAYIVNGKKTILK